MILKFLLVAFVIATVYFMFFKKRNVTKTNGSSKKKDKPKKSVMNEMIECSSCGIYAELDDCILSNNKYYCSQECVDKA